MTSQVETRANLDPALWHLEGICYCADLDDAEGGHQCDEVGPSGGHCSHGETEPKNVPATPTS